MEEEKLSTFYNDSDFKEFRCTNPALQKTLDRNFQSKNITHTQEGIKNK